MLAAAAGASRSSIAGSLSIGPYCRVGNMRRISVALAAITIVVTQASARAAVTPQLRLSERNAVPACATPERLQQFLEERNTKLEAKFKETAAQYKTHGEETAVRWDYAFFQMLVETNYLTFKRGNGDWGDVRAKQNNFAGIGATGDGEPGEKFPDVSTGVLAHLHHIRLYAGDPVDKPAAKRTKEVEDIILPWAKKFTKPITFTDLTKRWSPNDRTYSDSIQSVAERFREKFCSGEPVAAIAITADENDEPKASEPKAKSKRALAKLSKRSKKTKDEDQNSDDEDNKPSNKTASMKTKHDGDDKPATAVAKADTPKATNTPPIAPPAAKTTAPQTAAASTPPKLPAGIDGNVCRVWTASFGGEKSVLIQAKEGAITMFTALQVHAGKEKEEANAYILAYARGGTSVGEFATADQAITKAFELCPKA